MALSFYEAKQRLLSGAPLTWTTFGDHKAGSVHLASAGARRLFHFLLSREQNKVADAHESLFDDLLTAWGLETFDPATATQQSGTAANAGPCRLARIESSGFGGLNQVGGLTFPYHSTEKIGVSRVRTDRARRRWPARSSGP